MMKPTLYHSLKITKENPNPKSINDLGTTKIYYFESSITKVRL